MVMDQPKHILKSLYKLYNQLYFKNKVDFTVELEKHKFDPNGDTIVVVVYVTVDQKKYWSDSSEFDQEYYDFISSMDDMGEETLDEYVKYVVSDRLVFNRLYYKQKNDDIYEPILDKIQEMGYDCGLSHEKRRPYPIITVFNVDERDLYNINKELEKEFNIDDILITNE